MFFFAAARKPSGVQEKRMVGGNLRLFGPERGRNAAEESGRGKGAQECGIARGVSGRGARQGVEG